MPIVFSQNPDPTAATPEVKLTDDNMTPVLLLWLFMTTNSTFPGPTVLGDPTQQAEIAAALNITPATIQSFIAEVNNHPSEFNIVRTAFKAAANGIGYGGTLCPLTIDPIMKIVNAV